MNVLTCRNVVKQFKTVTAVNDVSFDVAQGEIFGLIGPNGAGKTTLLNCFEGLDRPTSGHIEVLGHNPIDDLPLLTKRIGVQLQTAALPPKLTVEEALRLYASFYDHTLPNDELLDTLGILEKKKDLVEKLSGGQRQRVFIALSLLHEPELVFLDELTTALDPQARLAMWDVVSGIRDRGTTVIMTTHYMEEAEHLCDRVGIIDHGKLIALDTIPNLIQAYGGESKVDITINQTFPKGWNRLEILGPDLRWDVHDTTLTLAGRSEHLQEVMGLLSQDGLTVTNVHTTSPNLEAVFLNLTGRAMRKETAS